MRGRLAVCSVALGVALGAFGGIGRAEIRRIALVDADAVLARAVAETLAPWGIAVAVIRPHAPGASMPASAERARALAATHRAGAVAWISRSVGGYALWVYDGDSGRVVARRLKSSPPFDEPGAAAVALSIKTLLRHSEVAPPQERYAAEVQQRARPRQLRLEASGGARLRDTGTWRVEPRLGIALVWWPAFLGGHVGGVIGGHAGVGVSVNESTFVGHYSDNAIELGARARIHLGGRFSLVPALCGAVHVSSLDGVVIGDDESAHVVRVNPSIDAALQGEVRVSLLRLGLRVGAAYMAQRQRYLIRGEEVYEVPAVELEAAIILGLPFY